MNKGNSAETVRDAQAVLKDARLASDTLVVIDALTALAQAEMKAGNFEQSLNHLMDALAYADKAHRVDRRIVLLTAMSIYYTHTKTGKNPWPSILMLRRWRAMPATITTEPRYC
jgi:hypothetical protein